MWPRLLYTVDLASNSTGDTSTLRHLMGKPRTATFFDNQHTTLLTKAFEDATWFATEGVYRLRKRITDMYDGI